MRDNLPLKIRSRETGIINLDSKENRGSHWTAYVKNKNKVIYFDSYGNLRPPTEVITYFNSNGKVKIFYTYDDVQKLNKFNCGQLALKFLYYNV